MNKPRKERGITIVDQHEELGRYSSKRWLFRVWDPRRRSYKSEAFDQLSPGWEWAYKTRSELTLELAVSGQVPLAVIGNEYIQLTRDRGGNPNHPDDMQRVVDAVVAAGATDLASESFGAIAYRWLKNAPPFVKHRGKPVSPHTRNKWFSYLRWIVTYARDTRKITHDPFVRYENFVVAKKPKEPFRLDEMRELLSDKHRDHSYWLRFCLLIYTGRRLNEALHSRWEWFDWSNNEIEVRRHPEYRLKRNKERRIPLQAELRDILWPIRQESGWIIADKKLRNPNNKQAWDQFRKFLKDCGIIERVDYPAYDPLADPATSVTVRHLSPHSTRHSYIGLRLATGESMGQVRREAGHSGIETTDEYADAEASYRRGVNGWPRGVFCFRRTPDEHRSALEVAGNSVAKPDPTQAKTVIIQFPARAAVR